MTQIPKPASLIPDKDRQRQLLTMLSKASMQLGRDFPSYGGNAMLVSKKLDILYQVGEGATSTVYCTKLGETEGAAKVMNNGFEHLAAHEKGILDNLETKGVPGLVESTLVMNGVLFLNSLLQPFDGTFTVEQGGDFVDFMAQYHAAGVVHRDILPENIMEDGHGKLRLIDWVFALIHNSSNANPPTFEGTFTMRAKMS